MTGFPNIDVEDASGISPKAKELVEIAGKYDGILSGYVISVSSGQPNPRISLRGFTITYTSKEMRELKKKLKGADHEPAALWVLGRKKKENLTKYKFHWD